MRSSAHSVDDRGHNSESSSTKPNPTSPLKLKSGERKGGGSQVHGSSKIVVQKMWGSNANDYSSRRSLSGCSMERNEHFADRRGLKTYRDM
jgi:hypothetical protein